MKMVTETTVIQPQAKEHQGLLEAPRSSRRGKKRSLPYNLREHGPADSSVSGYVLLTVRA